MVRVGPAAKWSPTYINKVSRGALYAMASDASPVQDQQQSFLQAYHEVNNSHAWEVCRRECDLCGKGPCGCGGKHCDECQADVQTKQCACGMVRCSNCLHVHIWCDPMVHDNDATAGSPTQPHRGKLLALPPASLQQPAAPSPATVAQPDSCTRLAAVAKHAVSNASCSQVAA